MELIANCIFTINVFAGIYVFYLSMGFKRTWLIRMRMTSIIWATVISIAYPLLNTVWVINEKNGSISVPDQIALSFNYWEASVGLMIMFTLFLMYLSIRAGAYGNIIKTKL